MSSPLEQLAKLQESVIHGYRTTKYVNYLGVSGHALVVVDFLHTFPAEVRLMWPTPLSLPKVLFFSLRYYIMVHHIFAILYALPPNLSPEVCMNGLVRIGVSSTAVIVASEAILFVRVYAFSGRKKKMLAYLIVQFIVLHVPGFVLLAKFLQSVRFVRLPMSNLLCMPVRMSSPLLGGLFGFLLGSVIIVMLIMMFIAYRKHRNFNSALLTVFYRDGIFYFICLSALAVGNIIVTFAANDGGLKFLLIQAEVDAHCILSTRMLLHLRASAEKEPIMKGGKLRYTGTIMDAMDFSTTCGPDTLRQVTITTTTSTSVDSDATVSTYAEA